MRTTWSAIALILSACSVAHGRNAGEGVYHSEKKNYKITYPKTWTPLKQKMPLMDFALMNGANVIMVSAGESNASLEEMVLSEEEDQEETCEIFKQHGKREIKVAGEPAVEFEATIHRTGQKLNSVFTMFTHQGMAYTVIGCRMWGREDFFLKDYRQIVQSISFLRERTAWLKKFRGTPHRTALMGGRVSFELNWPRWEETTFENELERAFLEEACYTFLAGGAWVFIRSKESDADDVEELEAEGIDVSGQYKKAEIERETVTAGKRVWKTMKVSGLFEGQPYTTRIAVSSFGGLSVHVVMDSVKSQIDTTRGDWSRLLNSFRSAEGAPKDGKGAYRSRRWRARNSVDPGLAEVLRAGVRKLSPERARSRPSISPDGTRAILSSEQGYSVADLSSGNLSALPLEPEPEGDVSWSHDGKRIAYGSENAVVVADLDPFKLKSFEGGASAVAWFPKGDKLILSTRGKRRRDYRVPDVTRLETLELGGGKRQVFLEFPLSRFDHFTVSPDGTWVALVTNLKLPRTHVYGGHLHICRSDGSGLRQVTDGPESFTSVAWADDGKALYAVRRLSAGKDGRVGYGGSTDLYYVPLDKGKALNLTRCGRIGTCRVIGNDIWLGLHAWGLDKSQTGVFAIPIAGLREISAKRRVPPIEDPQRQSRAVAEAVLKALEVRDIKECRPNSETLGRAARAFAEAAGRAYGVTLDFSAGSLDRFGKVVNAVFSDPKDALTLVFGSGAYYGKTLERAAGARWVVDPVPFGEWFPGSESDSTPLADAILPFDDVYGCILSTERHWLRDGESLKKNRHQARILLVYPSSDLKGALRKATGSDYYKMRKKLDEGKIDEAFKLSLQLVKKHPKNSALAKEALSWCEVAGREEEADNLARKAVEAGNEVPALVIRYADQIAKKNPKEAIRQLRKVVSGDWPPVEAYVKLGKLYEGQGLRPMAESCWRYAHRHAEEELKSEIEELMKLKSDTTEGDTEKNEAVKVDSSR